MCGDDLTWDGWNWWFWMNFSPSGQAMTPVGLCSHVSPCEPQQECSTRLPLISKQAWQMWKCNDASSRCPFPCLLHLSNWNIKHTELMGPIFTVEPLLLDPVAWKARGAIISDSNILMLLDSQLRWVSSCSGYIELKTRTFATIINTNLLRRFDHKFSHPWISPFSN